MPKQSPKQKRTVKRVMREFKEGALRSGDKRGPKVKSRKQAIAIALSEAGASREQQRGAKDRGGGRTKAELYAEAKRRDIAGRSGMSKKDLQVALARR